jgi:hypothetical protein
MELIDFSLSLITANRKKLVKTHVISSCRFFITNTGGGGRGWRSGPWLEEVRVQSLEVGIGSS